MASTTAAAEFEDETAASLLEGEITSIETHFSGESAAPVIVRGYDRGHRLHRGRYRRSFQNMTDSDIVKKVMSKSSPSCRPSSEAGRAVVSLAICPSPS